LQQTRIDSAKEMYPGFRRALARRGRENLFPESFRHFVSDYDEQWPETFVEGGMEAKL
jgi:hypothetical protein